MLWIGSTIRNIYMTSVKNTLDTSTPHSINISSRATKKNCLLTFIDVFVQEPDPISLYLHEASHSIIPLVQNLLN